MKKVRYWMFTGLALAGILSGCSEDPPPPPSPIVGDWQLDAYDIVAMRIVNGAYATSELTVTFQQGYGGLWGVNEYLDYYFDESVDSYQVTFNTDDSFERRLAKIGPDDISNGTWEVDQDLTQLFLSIDGQAFDEEYELVGGILETEMTWEEVNVQSPYLLIYPDAILADTLTDWSFDINFPERVLQVAAEVEFDVRYYFER